MTAETNVMDEFALAADGLAATAAHSCLMRVYNLCSGDPSRQGLHEALALGALSRRIGLRLEEGETAFARRDPLTATRSWSRALLLMNRLSRFATAGIVPRLGAHQKSGSAG
jgi:hypothetical protein